MIDWLTDSAHWSGVDGVPHRLAEHLTYTVIALAIALVIAVPLGLFIGHTGKGAFLVAGTVNALRALPTFGLLLLAFLVVSGLVRGSLGSLLPVYLVLVVLAAPPILAGTYAGVQATDRDARDAAYGMGMTGRQVLTGVEIPSALPLFMSGVRSATLQIVATATIAAYIGLGGLGRFVIDGLASQDYDQVIAGAVIVSALALLVELLLSGVQRLVVPRGLSGRYADKASATAQADPRTTVTTAT